MTAWRAKLVCETEQMMELVLYHPDDGSIHVVLPFQAHCANVSEVLLWIDEAHADEPSGIPDHARAAAAAAIYRAQLMNQQDDAVDWRERYRQTELLLATERRKYEQLLAAWEADRLTRQTIEAYIPCQITEIITSPADAEAKIVLLRRVVRQAERGIADLQMWQIVYEARRLTREDDSYVP